MIDKSCEQCQKTTLASSFNPCTAMDGRLNCSCECHDKKQTPGDPRFNISGHHLDCKCDGCHWKQRYHDATELKESYSQELAIFRPKLTAESERADRAEAALVICPHCGYHPEGTH